MSKKAVAVLLVLIILFLTGCASGRGDNADYPSSSSDSEAYYKSDNDASGEISKKAEEAPWLPEVDSSYEIYNYDDEDYNIRENNNEKYTWINENREESTDFESMLTLSLKVDTASYSNIQRYINNRTLPPVDAVRVEEMINYFNYDAELTQKEGPFYTYSEVGPSPFDPEKLMVFLRVKTEDIKTSDLPPSHLVFLIDTSGSMASHDKLPLLKESLVMLVDSLEEKDIVSIVTYAGDARVVLTAESGSNKNSIIKAINRLSAGGSTAGSAGITTAYEIAARYFVKNGNNRVILATDGDFNVGISSIEELERFISKKRESGVNLSILGFGTGNIREDIMETLAKNGNGNYNYINEIKTAHKVLIEELGSNLYTVARDVKAQVEFNPENVKNYRLIGYENRLLDNSDFNDDRKDAGEIGAGSDVIIMFEIELNETPGGYKYSSGQSSPYNKSKYWNELFELRIRYKAINEDKSRLIVRTTTFNDVRSKNSPDYVFACAVASFGHILRDSTYSIYITPEDVLKMAESARGADVLGYRYEFINLVKEYVRITR